MASKVYWFHALAENPPPLPYQPTPNGPIGPSGRYPLVETPAPQLRLRVSPIVKTELPTPTSTQRGLVIAPLGSFPAGTFDPFKFAGMRLAVRFVPPEPIPPPRPVPIDCESRLAPNDELGNILPPAVILLLSSEDYEALYNDEVATMNLNIGAIDILANWHYWISGLNVIPTALLDSTLDFAGYLYEEGLPGNGYFQGVV